MLKILKIYCLFMDYYNTFQKSGVTELIIFQEGQF